MHQTTVNEPTVDPKQGSNTPRPHVVTLVESINGGAEWLAAEIALRLDPRRFRSTICLTRSPEQLGVDSDVQAHAERRLAEAGTRVIMLKRTRASQLHAWLPLLAALRSDPPAVIHGHMFGSNLWAMVLGRPFGAQIVVHDHRQADPLRTPIVRLLTRHVIARGCAAAIAVSHETAGQMVDQAGFDPRRVHVILNGVPPVDGADGRRIRDELAIAAVDPVVVSVTALRPAKAVDVLIEAAAGLAPRMPGLRVLIAGDGPERRRLEALIREHRVERTVSLLGQRPDVHHLLAAANVAVLASDIEGTSLALMEYMEARLPIVATRVGGTPELIEDGVHGVLVAPQDPDAVADAIAGLLDDPARGRRLAGAAFARKRSLFEIDFVVGRVERLYDELLLSRCVGRRRGR